MRASRIQRISYIFPDTNGAAQTFFQAFAALLAPLANAAAAADQIVVTPASPTGALPDTALQVGRVGYPQVLLSTSRQFNIMIGQLQIRSKPAWDTTNSPLPVDFPMPPHWLPLDEVASRLRGHITHLDHSGVHIPASLLDPSRWEMLLREMAALAALYRYPREAWPFVLPTTDAEFVDDIRQFGPGREPKFQLVYDAWTQHPILRFNLATELAWEELEALFPESYGAMLPGFNTPSRTVFIAHPWPQLVIRFDLSPRGDGAGKGADWANGNWLVTEGARIRA